MTASAEPPLDEPGAPLEEDAPAPPGPIRPVPRRDPAALAVLLVDDSAIDAVVIARELRRLGRPLDLERVETADAMRASLERATWDVILSDWSLARFSAPAALEVVRERGLETPFIVVSGSIGEELAVDAMRAGARDYVLKEHLVRLGPAVERELREVESRRAQRVAEEARRDAELRFSRFFSAGVTGVTLATMDGTILEANDLFLEIVGYTRADFQEHGLNLAKLTPVEQHGAHPAQLAEILHYGRIRPYEKTYVRKDGTIVPVLVGVALIDRERLMTVVVDLTERKRIETALHERARAAAIVADVGLALTAGESLRAMLQRCCEALVASAGVIQARVWTHDPVLRRLALRASAGAIADSSGSPSTVGGLDVGIAVQARRARVSTHPAEDPLASERELAARAGLEWSIAQPLLVEGEVVGVLTMAAVEPPHEFVLAALATAADSIGVGIKGKLAEESKVSLEEQLRQSQKMEAVGRLAGGVAHDFNNLLSVVLSGCDLLLEDLPAIDPNRDAIEEIRRAGERATDLTRQLLMFSRQQVIEPKVLRVDEVLGGMEKMLRRLVGEDIELTTSRRAGEGAVRIDRSALEQVVMNLVVNARDAMPRGGLLTMETANVVLDPEFTETHLGATPGDYVMLAVSDSGCGMDRATRARIFEPFFTTKERGKGTGLGLSTVFGIVQQSGGTIWVYSEPGVGTTFKIYFPRLDVAPDETRAREAPGSRRGAETILLVEDDDPVRAVTRDVLTRHGYELLEARTPAEAVTVCREHPGRIHLLLSDVVMPGMSGPVLAQMLTALRPDMRVLCMSGYTDDAAVRHGVVDAAFAYLQKPITVDSLTRKVREVLDTDVAPHP